MAEVLLAGSRLYLQQDLHMVKDARSVPHAGFCLYNIFCPNACWHCRECTYIYLLLPVAPLFQDAIVLTPAKHEPAAGLSLAAPVGLGQPEVQEDGCLRDLTCMQIDNSCNVKHLESNIVAFFASLTGRSCSRPNKHSLQHFGLHVASHLCQWS